jgi:hypothetical protein
MRRSTEDPTMRFSAARTDDAASTARDARATLAAMGNVLWVGIAVCVMGCGHGASSSPPDGGGADGDGGPAGDAAIVKLRGTVHVTVLDPGGTGAPAPGVPVVYADPDGTVVAAINTDLRGRSQADVLSGGSITALYPTPQGTFVRMQTTLGVEPGDDVVIGSAPEPRSDGAFTVHWPAAPGSPRTYRVYGPCGLLAITGADTLSSTFSVPAVCDRDPMELLVWAVDVQDHTIGFDDASAIPFVVGGTVTLPDAWTSGMGFRASYTNLSGVSAIDFSRSVPDESGFSSIGQVFTNGGPGGTSVQTVPITAAGQMSSLLRGSAGGTQVVWQAIAGDAPTYQLDGGATLLAWLTPPRLDAAGQRVHVGRVTAGTSGAVADLLELDLSWVATGIYHQWTVFGPDAEDLQLPLLPSSLGAGLNLPAGVGVDAKAILHDADVVAGYAAVRANIDQALATTLQRVRRGQAKLVRTSSSQ